MPTALVLCIAAATFSFHLLTANRYGIFRDELYYLACSEHLDWGYVDQPPLIAFIAWIVRHVLGESLIALRLVPAASGAAIVWLTAKLARDLGAGAFAQILAALSVACIPLYLIVHHWLTMNAWEPLIWLGCAWCFTRAILRDSPRYFIWFGVLAGVGLENKYTIAFFLLGLAAGIVLTPARRFLATPQLWIGAALAGLIFLPNLIWLVRHDFPFLQLMHNIRQGHRDVVRGPVAFVLDQISILNPLLSPLWLGGLVWLFFGKLRALAIGYLALLAMMIALHGKNYYLASFYPLLLAAGSVAFEKLTATRWRWTRWVYIALIVISTAILAPTVSPILSPEHAIAYQKWLGIEPPRAENQNNGPLPQYFADEFGWQEMTAETARVYHSLSPADQKRTAIFANGYGEAAAIDFFGPRYGLPKSICRHQNYWYWGPRGYDGSSMIVLGSDGKGDREHFATVVKAGRVQHPYSRRDEWFDIFLCRDLKQNLQDAWSSMKHWD